MKILSIRIHQLHIPFTLELAHSMASRASCDSLIVEARTEGAVGFGEAVVREYVSGRLDADNSGGSPDSRRLEAAAAIVSRLAAPLMGVSLTWPELRSHLETADAANHELPILCGLEGALLDAACAEEATDVYGLLKRPPARMEMRYGGTLPFITRRAAERLLRLLGSYHPPDLRVKVGTDAGYADAVLWMVRGIFGDGYDIRVDANAGWSYQDALAHIPILRKHGVRLIEEPFGRGREENLRFARDPAAEGFRLVADESALTPQDIERMAKDAVFRMVNIRLAKNGGLLRAIRMAETARRHGLAFQIGSHVGETGILSAMGRVAASLLPDAAYLEGSYDGIVLSGNVTMENYTFGFDGRVPAITGRRLGYQVSEDRIAQFSRGVRECL